MTWPVT
jgi:hypothetical protein